MKASFAAEKWVKDDWEDFRGHGWRTISLEIFPVSINMYFAIKGPIDHVTRWTSEE